MRWRLVIPVVVVLMLIVLLGYGLTRRPDVLPSALIDKPAPQFDLPTLASDRERIRTADLKGKVTLVNVWASWCVACRAEHALITEISRRTGVPVVGLNYKDTKEGALRWLGRYGNPFAVVAFDRSGEVGIDWGVAAVPETFVVDRQGTIRYKVVGAITRDEMNDTLVPTLERLKASGS
ncbi:DsbE family thiol:disulfide interchange protein [Endozoicomonas sp. G2_2]|uniref:DsbE family thiol:disulfide interchange protein n=1 Tax=Endozoicomonas sp. G2_2 TaxID=2821092 RepID=UPI001AD996FE|nr:DsbE family thiol:disulfide interchange protein [Endozoicomonas sp. G2_2]MBO9469095.1 DsbE family thiol:disulfide interchange protein [Endozoicomonas sp. G2_2]